MGVGGGEGGLPDQHGPCEPMQSAENGHYPE